MQAGSGASGAGRVPPPPQPSTGRRAGPSRHPLPEGGWASPRGTRARVGGAESGPSCAQLQEGESEARYRFADCPGPVGDASRSGSDFGAGTPGPPFSRAAASPGGRQEGDLARGGALRRTERSSPPGVGLPWQAA